MKKLLLLILFPFVIYAQAMSDYGGVFVEGIPMQVNRMSHIHTVLPDSNVLLIGGHGTGFVSLANAEVIDCLTNESTLLNMNFPHDGAALVRANNGYYYIFGGAANLGVAPGYNTVEYFDPSDYTFKPINATMQYGRMFHNGTLMDNGSILIVGGWYDQNSATYGEVFNPRNNIFTTTQALNTPRSSPILVPTTDGKVTVFGGTDIYGTINYQKVEEFDPETNAFTVVSETLFPDKPNLTIMHNNKEAGSNIFCNGKYIYFATDNSTSESFFFTFDPISKVFEKLNLDYTFTTNERTYIDWTLNLSRTKIYLLAAKYEGNSCGAQLFHIYPYLSHPWVQVYNPPDFYPMENSYFLTGASLDPLFYTWNENWLLVSGGTTSNDYNTNFTPVNSCIVIATIFIDDVKDENVTPDKFELNQNYPNPFNPNTTISYQIPNNCMVTLKIYDVLGKEITTLVDGYKTAGKYSVTFDGSKLASGMYIYQMNAGNFTNTKKLVLMK